MKKALIALYLFTSLSLSMLHAAPEYVPGGTDQLTPGVMGANLDIVTYTSEPCGIAGEKGGFAGFFGNSNQM